MTSTARDVSVFCVAGPPGAGKSTALIALAARHPWLARFGVRDYGLSLAEASDPLGLAVRDSLLRGDLLTDAQVRQEFEHFFARLPNGTAAVAVEGYPRSMSQCTDLAAALDGFGVRPAALIVVDIPDATARERVVGRGICTRCGTTVPANKGPDCPDCGGEVRARKDDAADKLTRRLADYRACDAAIRASFDEPGRLFLIDGLRDPQIVQKDLETLLSSGRGAAWT